MACTRNRVRSTAASISFVLVLPLVPVTATTGPGDACAPRARQSAVGGERIRDRDQRESGHLR